MPESTDRERSLIGYAAEVRAFHTFLGAVLIALAVTHLVVVIPFVQLRAAAPALAAAAAAADRQAAAVAQSQKALADAAEAMVGLRRALEAAPSGLHRAIGSLVASGRAAAGDGNDPYKATIRVPGEGGQAPGQGGGESVTVEEAIRREIGRQTEGLATTVDAALAPLRASGSPLPEIDEAVRPVREVVVRNILALNEALREAFAAEPEFWQRLGAPGVAFEAASPRAGQLVREIDEALRAADRRVAAGAATLRDRVRADRSRAALLAARERDLRRRLETMTSGLGWMPVGPDGWARLYPLAAGALALTVLFRLRRLLLVRRSLGGGDLDAMAPSWIVGPVHAPGRWWAVVLIALPLAAAIHGAAAVAADPGLFVSAIGEPSPAMRLGFSAAYAAVALPGLVQFLAAARGLLAAQPVQAKRQGGGRSSVR